MNTTLFKDHLRPHTPEEKRKLERSILADGCRDPLVVGICQGKEYLIDGFHRLAICEANSIEYQTIQIVFANTEDILIWMERNARAKRNPTGTERNYYLGCRYNREKKAEGRPRGKLAHGEPVSDGTATIIANDEGVGHATVKRAAKMAKHVDDICIGSLAFLKWVILTERIKYNKKLLDEIGMLGAGGCKDKLEELLASTDPEKAISPKVIREALNGGENSGEEEEDEMIRTCRRMDKIVETLESIANSPDRLAVVVTRLTSYCGMLQRRLETMDDTETEPPDHPPPGPPLPVDLPAQPTAG